MTATPTAPTAARRSFWRFLMSNRSADSPIGDLARDAHMDWKRDCLTNHAAGNIRAHLSDNHGACGLALDAFDDAYSIWKNYRPVTDSPNRKDLR